MHFNATAEYPAPAEKVAELFANPEFIDAKIAASRATEGTKKITGDPSGSFTVETRRTLPAELVPEQYRKFLPGGVVLTLVEEWGASDANGDRSGVLGLKIAGAPASATGSCTLTNTGTGASRLTYDGDVKVSIPMFGAKIEKMAVGALEQIMSVERDVAVTWLA